MFFVGVIAVGLLNYLFYPILGRLLTPSYFGEVQTLFSILTHITIFFNVLGLVVVNIVANQKSQAEANKIIVELEKFAVLLSFATFIVFLALVVPLKHFFQFGSAWPLIGLGLTILISVPLAFRRAVLQGIKDFSTLSWASVLAAFLKLILAISFVDLGYKTGGTIVAILIAQIVALIYVAFRLKRLGQSYRLKGTKLSLPDMKAIKPELVYAGLTLIVSLIFTVQYSIDVLSVKHYFPPDIAGLYAGISTISNIIFFVSGSVSGVLIATIKIGAHANTRLLKRSLIFTFLIGGGSFVIFALLPKLVIQILLGKTYTPYAHYLPSISFALLLISFANLLFIYHMAQRAYAISTIGIVGSVITFVLMLANHTSVQAIINNVITGSAILLLGIAAFTYIKRGRNA